jgi:hypothetical protein
MNIIMDWIHLNKDRNQLAEFCENGNGPVDSVIGEEFLDQVSDC